MWCDHWHYSVVICGQVEKLEVVNKKWVRVKLVPGTQVDGSVSSFHLLIDDFPFLFLFFLVLCVCACVCVCMHACVCVCAMYVLCSVDPISSLQSVLWFNIGSVESFERSLENAQVEMNIEPANYVSVIYKTETEMWDPVQFFSRVLPFFSFFAWWPVGILDILGCSGRVVWLWSFDFYPASLKSLGCFYFWWVLSSQWKAERVNLWSLQCQL